MNMPEEAKRPRILSDAPADHDTFGAHQRIADAITHLIRTSEGGKTVAIEGDWGAGKSTVVHLLAKQHENSNVLIHVYDAWVHVGDPLRRAFLTALVRALLDAKWIDSKEDWETELDRLARKVKDTTTQTTPRLTGPGKWVLLSLFLVPLGYPLLTQVAEELFERHPWLPGLKLGLGIGLALTLAPLIVYCVCWLFSRQRPREGLLPLLLRRTTTQEHTQSIETPDPTTIEFQSAFAKVMGSALDPPLGAERKLVLVIDNLDRLQEAEAHQIWSLLRSFVDAPVLRHHDWAKRFWVVVPIAKHTTQRLTATKEYDDQERPAVAQTAFLDKVFQVRFALPTPVLRNWRDYLRAALKDAFGNGTRDEFQLIADLAQTYWDANSEVLQRNAPSPRDVVLLVNQLVSLHLQWGDQFPLPVLAAYVLETRSGNIVQRLRAKSIPSEPFKQLLERDLTGAYAALYYNIGEIRQALELLQTPVAQDALAAGDGERLVKEIRDDSSFAEVVRHEFLRNGRLWGKGDQEQLFRGLIAVLNLSVQTPTAFENSAEARVEAERMCKQVLLQVPRWFQEMAYAPLFAPSCTTCLSRLVSKTASNEILESVWSLIQRIRKLPEGEPVAAHFALPGTVETTATWSKSLLTLLNLPELHPFVLKSDLRLPLTPEQLGVLLATAAKERLPVPEKVSIAMGVTSVGSHLTQVAQQDKLSNNDTPLVAWLAARDIQVLAPFVDAASKRLATLDMALEKIEPLVRLLRSLRHRLPSVESELKTLVSRGALYHQLQRLQQAHSPAQGLVALAILEIRPDAGIDAHAGNSQQGHQLLQALVTQPKTQAELFKQFKAELSKGSTAGWLLTMVEQTQVRALVTEIFQDVANWSWILPAIPLDRVSATCKVLAPTVFALKQKEYEAFSVELLKSKREDQDFAKKLAAQVKGVAEVWLVSTGLPLIAGNSEQLQAALAEVVGPLRAEDWGKELGNRQSSVAEAIMLALERGANFLVGDELRRALRDFVSQLLSSSAHGKASREQVSGLLKLLPQGTREGLADDVYENACAAAGTSGTTPDFWSYAGDLVGGAIARQPQLRQAGRRLFWPIVQRPDKAGLAWVEGFLEAYPDAVEISGGDAAALDDIGREIAKMRSTDNLEKEQEAVLEALAAKFPAPSTL